MEDKKELLCLDNTDIFIPQFEERDVRICAQKILVGVCVAICTMGLLRVLDSYPFYDLSWNRCATFADSARIFFVIISLVVTTNFWKRVWRSQSLGVLDGFLCSYVALGLYLVTHLFLHPAMLLVAFVVCALVALVGLRVERASREDVLRSVVSLIAAFSFALVILNYFGVAPVVKSQVDLAKGAGTRSVTSMASCVTSRRACPSTVGVPRRWPTPCSSSCTSNAHGWDCPTMSPRWSSA